jgi:hypothetical protein
VHSFAENPDGDDDSDYGDVTGHMRVSRSAKWVRQTLRRDALGRRLDLATTGVKPFWFDDSTARQLAPGSVVAGAAAVGVVPEPGAAVLVAGAAGIALLRRPRRQGLRTGA